MNNYEVKIREAESLLPRFFLKLRGNGNIHLDTDSMSMAYPEDRRMVNTIASVIAELVLNERDNWKPQTLECSHKVAWQTKRIRNMESLLEQLREVSSKDDVSVSDLKVLVESYEDSEQSLLNVESHIPENSLTEVTDETKQASNLMERESERIFPKLYGKMIGNGGLRLDTDRMSLTDSDDRDYLSWLARIAAGFVLEEADLWKRQVEEGVEAVAECKARMNSLDLILEQLRKEVSQDNVTVETLQDTIKLYRNPIEAYYDKLAYKRKQEKAMTEWANALTEHDREQETGE